MRAGGSALHTASPRWGRDAAKAAGVGNEAHAARPTKPPLGAGNVPSRCVIEALREHPRFREATRALIGGLVERYSRNRLLNRVVNDRGRLVGSLIALYLYFSSAPGDGGNGLTAGRFQAFCVDLKLCSSGRARALLLLMRYAGYLAPEPCASDRRRRCLAPTERLIEEQRQRWSLQFEAMALITPTGRAALEALKRPEFTAAFMRHLGATFLAGFRLLDHAPDLARLVESNAGLLVAASLFRAALDRPLGPDGTAVPVSISSLAARFGVTRAHVRNLLAEAAEAGLVKRSQGSETVLVLPRLIQAGSDFFAALFALQAHCAQAAVEEIGAAP